jgi:hypothetical protein
VLRFHGLPDCLYIDWISLTGIVACVYECMFDFLNKAETIRSLSYLYPSQLLMVHFCRFLV